MSRAMAFPPARVAALLAVAIVVAAGAVLALDAAPAQAAKPCWKRVLDDWNDNGRVDGVYSARCLQQAVDHLPEDIRIYSNAEETIKNARHVQSRGRGVGVGRRAGSTSGGRRVTTPVKEVEPRTGPRDEGPIQSVLGYRASDADSIPIPLIVLAGLSLLLMAAGGAGFAARKLQARRPGSGSS